MFNIDKAIAVWRRQLSASGALGKDDLDELESHLRDELDEQVESGRGAEEAFTVAIAKLGHATAIQKEFTKGASGEGGLFFRIISLFCGAGTTRAVRSFFGGGQFVIPSPILDSLSVNALQSLGAAREQAAAWNHNFVGTEHLLLGLLETSGSKILEVLKCWNLDALKIRKEIQAIAGVSSSAHEYGKPAPYTPRAQQALRLAAGEADAREKESIAVEDIFLGLIEEGSGIAAVVLKKAGVDLERAREEIEKAG